MVRLPDGMAQSSASILVLGQSLGLSAAQHFYVPLHTYLCMYIYRNIFQLFLFSHFILQHSVVFLFFFLCFPFLHNFCFSIYFFAFATLNFYTFVHVYKRSPLRFFLLAQATINLLQLTVFYSLSTPLTIFRLLKAEAVKA